MDLIAERGIAAHYTGRVFGSGLVGHAMPNGRSSRGKTVCLNNANIALRVFHHFVSLQICDNQQSFLKGFHGKPFQDPNFNAILKYEVLCYFQVGWLNAIREWQEEFVGNMSSREFVDTITRDLLGSRVFVFTPRGEVRQWILLHISFFLLSLFYALNIDNKKT